MKSSIFRRLHRSNGKCTIVGYWISGSLLLLWFK